jgi:DNA (cytosine-5)-methyltransferase 1
MVGGSAKDRGDALNIYNDFDPKVCAWAEQLVAAGHVAPGTVLCKSIKDVAADEIRHAKQVHFFAGILGWPLALRLAGWGNRPIWSGSCPCQPFSAAGKRKGTADERHLWPDMLRLIRECRPSTVVGEQVASSDGREWLAGVRTDLEALGYEVGAADLCAASVGAPHIRQRLFWVADTQLQRAGAGIAGEQGSARIGRDRLAIGGEVGGLSNARHDDGAARSARGQFQPKAPEQQEPGRGSPWDDFTIIPCGDGKARRIKRGISPLVARLPRGVVPSGDYSVQNSAEARADRLKGYGNSIVPAVAAAFIRAYIEARGLE